MFILATGRTSNITLNLFSSLTVRSQDSRPPLEIEGKKQRNRKINKETKKGINVEEERKQVRERKERKK
jgi:hypothetical protein